MKLKGYHKMLVVKDAPKKKNEKEPELRTEKRSVRLL